MTLQPYARLAAKAFEQFQNENEEGTDDEQADLRAHEPQVAILEHVRKEADRMADADLWIHLLQDTAPGTPQGIAHQLPGTSHFPSRKISFSQALDCFIDPL